MEEGWSKRNDQRKGKWKKVGGEGGKRAEQGNKKKLTNCFATRRSGGRLGLEPTQKAGPLKKKKTANEIHYWTLEEKGQLTYHRPQEARDAREECYSPGHAIFMTVG